MIDTCSHSVDLYRFLVGEPTSVMCMTGNVAQDLPVEDFCLIALSADGDVFGEITASHSFAVGSNEVAWYGTRGTAIVTYGGETSGLAYQVAGDAWQRADSPETPNRFEAEIAHFIACVRSNVTPAITVGDGLKASQIITAAYRAAAEERAIPLDL
jgi:predicted dehydrogenase